MSPNRAQAEKAEPPAGRWRWVAVGAVIALAGVVACNKVWNVDVFWHLKSGQWMLEHFRVLGHDPFSVDGPAEWVNVHWGFQVLVAALHWLGGFSALVVLKMAVFAGVLAVLALWLRRRIGPAWLMLAGLWLVLASEARVRVRPEIITYLLLMATLVILESVRRGASPRRLWWLVPINVLWVNVHGVFIVGLAASWMALAGAGVDRLLKRPTAGKLATTAALAAILASTAACLISPWPLRAALHPLLLGTRVSGEQQLYTFGVQELRPTYLINPFRRVPVLVNLIGAIVVLELLRARRRQVPIGHALWYLVFLAAGVMATRNLALFAVAAGFLLAVHGGELAGELVRRHRWLGRMAAPARVVMLALLAATAVAYATEGVYRWQRRNAHRFGFGLIQGEHPIATAQWLGRVDLSGDILPLEFGHGGTFICYAYPRRKVWIDGRLEVHPMRRLERLYEYRTKMLSAQAAADAKALPLPKTVRFIAVRASDTGQIRALSDCEERFKLVHVDRAGACFARLPVPGEEDHRLLWKWHREEPLPAANLSEFDRPLRPAAPALLKVETRRRWYRQNVPAAHWRMGRLLHFLGQDALAVRYLTAAERLGIEEPVRRAGLLAWAHQVLRERQPVEPEFELCDLPADPNLCRALALYETMNLANLRDRTVRSYALKRLHGLFTAQHIDAGLAAMEQYRRDMPIPDRWHPSAEAIQLENSIRGRHEASGKAIAQVDFSGYDPAQRAYVLLDLKIDSESKTGLIDAAIDVLAKAPNLPRRTRMLLGDLYLRKGQTARARREYKTAGQVKTDGASQMRRGLCDWADGDFFAAVVALTAAARSAPKSPEPAVYLALLHEQLGHYAAAAEAAAAYAGPTSQPMDNQAVQLLAQVKVRLKMQEPSAGGPE